jgi:predicted SAM-dependent methyltransferase
MAYEICDYVSRERNRNEDFGFLKFTMNPPARTLEKIKRPSNSPLKLNLGGRDTHLEGFLNVDIRPGNTVDVLADIEDLSMFKDGEITEIYASNCLEHFYHTETVRILKEWRRVLKKGGKCYISVPDLMASIELVRRQPGAVWPIYLLYGDQQEPLNFHYINFTFPMLARNAIDAGFNDIKRIKNMPYGLKDASQYVDNIYQIPISLNVEAIA